MAEKYAELSKAAQSEVAAAPAESDIVAADLAVANDIVHAAENEYTPEQYKKLLWKIDLLVLPLMWIASGTQYADKVGLATQATFGIIQDTNLVGTQYSWLTSIFYIAFLVGEAPGNYILQISNINITIAASMFAWGILVLCMAFAKNFADLMVIRFFLGLAECTTYPALLIVTASWYTKREHALRSVIWATANAGMYIICSLIEFAIGDEAKRHPGGLAPWKGISYYLGAQSLVLSVFIYFLFGTPREVRWLNAEEKRMASARIVDSQTGSDAVKRSKWKWDQVRTAFIDPQTWFLFVLVIVNSIPNGGTTSFGNLVYQGFGFDALQTLIKGTIPQQAFSVVFFLFAGYINYLKPNLRFYFMMFSVIPAFVGMLALALLPRNDSGLLWVRWGVYFMTICGNLAGPLIWTLVPSNVAGRTKKSVTSTVLFIAYCTGNSIGAQVFQTKDAPLYLPAIIVCSTMYGLEFVLMLVWRQYYVWQNNRRDKIVAEMGISKEEAQHQGRLNGESDVTDWENIHFRYSL